MLRKMILVRALAVLLLVSIVLTGCLRTKILERIGLIVAVGYEKGEKENEINGYTVVEQVEPKSKTNVQIIASKAFTSKGLRDEANRKSAKLLKSGQLRVALYGQSLAEKGIISIMDTLYRDVSISNMVYLAVVKGDVKDLLEHKYPHINDIGSFLYDMFEQNIHSEEIMPCTLHDFLNSYFMLADPLLPIIQREDNQIVIKGLAAFKNDKMVTTFTSEEASVIHMVKSGFKSGLMEITIDDVSGLPLKSKTKQLHLVVDDATTFRKIKLVSKEEPRFSIKIKMKQKLQEISLPIEMDDMEVIKELEKKINERLEYRLQKLIKECQQLGIDPFGFGEIYRAGSRGETILIEDWRELFPKAKFDIEIDCHITRAGEVD